MNKEKLNALNEIKDAMDKLREAWIDTTVGLSNIFIDCNDYIQEDYPFEQSFDEIDVVGWIDCTSEKLEKAIAEIQ